MAPPPLPNTTPQAAATYFNKYLNGGKPISLSGVPSGSNLGDQWLAWYAQEQAAGKTGTLVQFEEAFVILWTDATLGQNLSTALGAAATDIGTAVNGIGPGISQFNQDLGGAPAAAAGAYSAATSWESSLSGILGDLTSKSTWMRAIKIIGGIGLIAIGLVMMADQSKTVQSAARTVATGAHLA